MLVARQGVGMPGPRPQLEFEQAWPLLKVAPIRVQAGIGKLIEAMVAREEMGMLGLMR